MLGLREGEGVLMISQSISVILLTEPMLRPTRTTITFSHSHELILTAVRVAYGIMWFGNSLWKNPPHFGLYTHQDFYFWVVKPIEYPVIPIFSTFVEMLVIPNLILFGWIVFMTELVLGIGFIIGFKTKWLAVVALVQTIFIALSVLNTPHEWPWSYYLMAMVAMLFLILPSTRLSLDLLILRRHGTPGQSKVSEGGPKR